ncbi:MAG: DUF3575 domain-containing protein [Tannerellaceae bacterium]|jgi:hypothetical protein|nr:DUF3575 domain-containing protein [Tannerellaceae bacterium]
MNKLCISFLFCIASICTASAQKLAVKSNILYDATGTVNLGAEYAITKNISASISANYNGWTLKKPMVWKHILVQPEARYWLREVFNEHFAGLHFIYTNFNIERLALPMFGFQRKYLYQEGTAYGGGISYGYHLYLTPRMNIEFSLGMGYLNLTYKKYEYTKYPQPAGEEPAGLLGRSYVGPTQISLTFVYIIM